MSSGLVGIREYCMALGSDPVRRQRGLLPLGSIAVSARADAGTGSENQLDGTGRLLDIGCGPGSLTLPLAPHYADGVAIDADPDMIRVASGQATSARARPASAGVKLAR